MSINRTVISGNLTRDPELRTTKGGTPVLSLSVAFSDYVRSEDGKAVERPNYIDATLFGKRAESIAEHLAKGTHVTLDGKLRFSQWEQDGIKRSKLELILDDIDFASNRAKS